MQSTVTQPIGIATCAPLEGREQTNRHAFASIAGLFPIQWASYNNPVLVIMQSTVTQPIGIATCAPLEGREQTNRHAFASIAGLFPIHWASCKNPVLVII
jgi:hypothetical protein